MPEELLDPLWEVVDLKNADNDPKAPRLKPHSKKYKGKKLCECVVDYSRSPVLTKCKNQAVAVFYIEDSPNCVGACVCNDCLVKLKEYYENKVNWRLIARAATARARLK